MSNNVTSTVWPLTVSANVSVSSPSVELSAVDKTLNIPMLLVIVMLPVKLAPLMSAVATPVNVYANDVVSIDWMDLVVGRATGGTSQY